MSLPILTATLHQRRWSIIWYSAGLVFYSWLMVWFWPLFGGEEYTQLVDSLPKEVLAAFGTAELSLGTLGGYMQVEYLGLMWMIIVSSAIILYATKACASEIDAGTMELLLAQPLSRTRLMLTRIAGLVIVALALSAATFVPIQIFGPRYTVDLSAEVFWLLFAQGTLFILAIGGITLVVSAFSSSGGRPAAFASGLLGAMWVLHFVAEVSEVAEALETINLLRYWEPGRIINDASANPDAWWVYGCVTIVSFGVAVWGFARRDAV